MIHRLAGIGGLMFAVLSLAAPAGAQIILGGKPVQEEPPIVIAPGVAPTTPSAPAAASTFPADPDAGNYTPLSIATPAFISADDSATAIAAKIAEVIRADLASVGVFTAPDASAVAAFTADIGAVPGWADWTGAGVNALLLGKASIGAGNSLTVQFRLYDIAASKQVLGKQYVIPAADQWRRAAHKVADDVLVALVGGQPGFDSRIAFVSEAAGKTRLGIVDQDGGGVEFPLASVTGLEAPRFSPTTQTIVYSADAPVPGKPTQAQRTTIVYDMDTGRRDPLTTLQPQPNADARYSADGRTLIYSRKVGANTDIYLIDLPTRKETRLTDDKASDTAPALSPDGKMYVFVSDRAGASHVYAARVDGADLPCASGPARICQLTTERGADATPVWSPRSDWIALSRRVGDVSAIHLVKPDGSDARQLTSPADKVLDLWPTWSPDGRRLAFSRVIGDGAQLHTVAVNGGSPTPVATSGPAFEPSWGPKLP